MSRRPSGKPTIGCESFGSGRKPERHLLDRRACQAAAAPPTSASGTARRAPAGRVSSAAGPKSSPVTIRPSGFCLMLPIGDSRMRSIACGCGVGVEQDPGRSRQRHGQPGHRRHLRRVDAAGDDEHVRLDVAGARLHRAQPAVREIEADDFHRVDASSRRPWRRARGSPRVAPDRIGAAFDFRMRGARSRAGHDVRLERAQLLLVDEVNRISPRLEPPHRLGLCGGALGGVGPFERAAPRDRQLAAELGVQLAPRLDAEQAQREIRMRLLLRVDPREGVGGRAASRRRAFSSSVTGAPRFAS